MAGQVDEERPASGENRDGGDTFRHGTPTIARATGRAEPSRLRSTPATPRATSGD